LTRRQTSGTFRPETGSILDENPGSVLSENQHTKARQPARTAIRGAVAKLFFLPAYSLDLNPIEMVFAKLKTLLRKADERSIEATWRKIGDLLAAFSTEECAAYLRHAGYASMQT